MNSGKILTSVGVFLAVTIPYWMVIPAVGFLLEIVLAIALILGVIDRHLKVLGIGLILGLLLGTFPGMAPLPFSVFFPLWLKAVLPALALAMLINRGWQAGRSFVLATLILAGLIMIMYVQGVEIIEEQIDLMIESFQSIATGTLSSQGYNTEVINEMVDWLAKTGHLIKRLLPGMLILSGTGQLFIAFVAIEWYYTRRDSYFPGFGPFVYWKIPENLIYFLGITILARLIPAGGMDTVADNIIFILAFFYAVCGLALIEHLLRRLQLPMFIKVIFYIGLFLMQLPGMMIASAAGLFDSYFDFRKVRAHTLG